MPGLAPALKHSKNQEQRASWDTSGPLTHVDIERANTGRCWGDLTEWGERRVSYERMARETERMAGILESGGVNCRLPSALSAVGLVTGAVDRLDVWRNVNVLPLVASRNRRPILKMFRYWLEKHGNSAWGYPRYAVITSGERMPIGADLRGAIQAMHRRISKWAYWARHTYQMECLLRVGELTVDEDLTFHPHANVVYRPTRRLSRPEWQMFLRASEKVLGAHWRDCGRVIEPAEVVKYFAKGDDLQLLNDAACLVGAWADEAVSVGDLAVTVAERWCNKLAPADRACTAPASLYQQARAHCETLRADLSSRAVDGGSHPLVWLYGELSGLHLVQTFGAFRKFSGDLRQSKLKVQTVWTPRGGQLVLARKRLRDVSDSDADMPSSWPENQVIAVQAPAPRFCPWAEPVAIVSDYAARPRSRSGESGLLRLQQLGERARAAWVDSGAPAPSVAVARAGMILSGSGGDGLPLAGVGPGSLYGSHMYENCPGGGEPPGDRERWVVTNHGLTNVDTGEIVEWTPVDQIWNEIEEKIASSESAESNVCGYSPVYWWHDFD